MQNVNGGLERIFTYKFIIEKLHQFVPETPLEKWYLLSMKWMHDLQQLEQANIKTISLPIDNTDLVDYALSEDLQFFSNEMQQLDCLDTIYDGRNAGVFSTITRNALSEYSDYLFVPKAFWNELVKEFGIKEPVKLNTIARYSVVNPKTKEIVIEVSPIFFTIHNFAISTNEPILIIVSKYDYVSKLIDVICKKLNCSFVSLYNSEKNIRLKSDILLNDYGFSLQEALYYSFDEDARIYENESIKIDSNIVKSEDISKFHSSNLNYFYESTIKDDSGLKLDNQSFLEQSPKDTENSSSEDMQFDSDSINSYISGKIKNINEDSSDSDSSISIEEDSSTEILPNLTNFCQSSNENVSLFRGKDGRLLASKNAGLRGLQNLGNTCFMNSAIQSLSHCVKLTEFFLDKRFLAELNVTNPLGMKGQLALAYARLLTELWNGEKSAFYPNELKYIMSKFNVMFSGYHQHDSQEFLGFLLDGLHEDLNRIHDKPILPNKEYDGENENEFSLECWSAYKQRNDSIIVDKFHGQCKSTLVCPECKFVSVTFDPMAYLALPIPINNSIRIEIAFVPKNSTKISFFSHSFPKSYRIEDLLGELYENHPDFTESGKEFIVYEINLNDLSLGREMKEYQQIANIGSNSILTIYEVENDSSSLDPVFIYFALQDKVVTFPLLLLFTPYSNITVQDVNEQFSSKYGINYKDENVKNIYLLHAKQFSYRAKTEIVEFSEKCSVESGLSIFVSYEATVPSALDPVRISSLDFLSSSFSENAASKEISLYDCLNLYVSPEKLSHNNLWYCSRCKDHRQATKKFDIWRCSEYLVIFLKRFSRSSMFGSKITCNITFPIEDLNLSQYLPPNYSTACRYNLVAVINHMGGVGGGHYTAYAHNEADSCWYLFDDSSVCKVSTERLVSPSAYVLFYRQVAS